MRVADVVLDTGACVHLHGKGRKQRTVPLWKTTVKELHRWLRMNPSFQDEVRLTSEPRRSPHDPLECRKANSISR